jgi:SAM-dependent methyltransferase
MGGIESKLRGVAAHGAEVDFGKTAADYARHRAGFPEAFFGRLAAHGVGLPGQRLLDLGTGTGALARAFAARGAEVTGLDVARPLLDEAARLAEAAGLRLAIAVGRAEDTGLAGASFDVVTAGQCWHWFDCDRAAAEARRLLRPGGALVIAHFDWLAIGGNVVDATEALIEEHNPRWPLRGATGLAGVTVWQTRLREAGFRDLALFAFDVDVPYSHEAWRGRIRASAGVGASLPPAEVLAFDAALAKLLAERFPGEPLAVPHQALALVARVR